MRNIIVGIRAGDVVVGDRVRELEQQGFLSVQKVWKDEFGQLHIELGETYSTIVAYSWKTLELQVTMNMGAIR